MQSDGDLTSFVSEFAQAIVDRFGGSGGGAPLSDGELPEGVSVECAQCGFGLHDGATCPKCKDHLMTAFVRGLRSHGEIAARLHELANTIGLLEARAGEGK